MKYVKLVSYKILVNGSLGYQITPKRGLRQGDSISLYLFLICMEGLSFCLRRMEDVGDIEMIKIKRNNIKKNNQTITHLLFAYDCYIFIKK